VGFKSFSFSVREFDVLTCERRRNLASAPIYFTNENVI
jgi:hypothetical protein